MRGLLNSAEFVELPDHIQVEIDEVHETRPPGISVVASRFGDELWRTVLPGFAPDVASAAVDINTVDYRLAPFGELLVIAGEERAYLIADGAVRRELLMGSTGRASALDFLSVFELRSAPLLVIASAKVVWVVDRNAQVRTEFRYEGLVHSVREGAPGEVVVSYYDRENPSLPVVDYVLG